jgi:hypothetical protein
VRGGTEERGGVRGRGRRGGQGVTLRGGGPGPRVTGAEGVVSAGGHRGGLNERLDAGKAHRVDSHRSHLPVPRLKGSGCGHCLIPPSPYGDTDSSAIGFPAEGRHRFVHHPRACPSDHWRRIVDAAIRRRGCRSPLPVAARRVSSSLRTDIAQVLSGAPVPPGSFARGMPARPGGRRSASPASSSSAEIATAAEAAWFSSTKTGLMRRSPTGD